MKLCLLTICFLVIIVTVSAHGGGGGKGKGKGPMKHLKKWKKCGDVEAKYEELKKMWDECKAANPKPDDSEGGEESGDKPKKHEHMKKIFDCTLNKTGITTEDGSFDGEKFKAMIKQLYGDELGTKLGDKIMADCGEKLAAAKEGEGKGKAMKCCGEAHKAICKDPQTQEDD